MRRLQLAGIACGFAAGAWLGAAEAPTKMVTLGLSPVVISLTMVLGVCTDVLTQRAGGAEAVPAKTKQAPPVTPYRPELNTPAPASPTPFTIVQRDRVRSTGL